MPFLITPDDTSSKAFVSLSTLELVARNCHLTSYKKIRSIPSFNISGDLIAYASPDSTYAVTRRLLDAAKKEIIIGIYDFSADYMREIMLQAMRRGVKISVMLDIDNQKEKDLFKELARFGATTTVAPSCASAHISYFPSSHEKVIVIDKTWTLVQSGNYSNNSIPFNETDGGDPDNFVTGNRDMGIAIHSEPLANFFRKLLLSDMKLETDGEKTAAKALAAPRPLSPPLDLVEEAPQLSPVQLFPSKTFKPVTPIKITPVLAPDNYMDLIPGFIENATKSIFIEQQYIRSSSLSVGKLLTSIKKAKEKNPGLDVRIILGKLFGQDDVKKEKINIANLSAKYGLVLDKNIRYIDTKRFVHCHNKMIIIDENASLISSQNWSETGVSSNREAGLIIYDPAIAHYYTQIFESDWSTAQKAIPSTGSGKIQPRALMKGNFITVSAADYQEV